MPRAGNADGLCLISLEIRTMLWPANKLLSTQHGQNQWLAVPDAAAYVSSSNSAFASLRSGASKPSVNQL